MSKQPYAKEWLSHPNQVRRLADRGLDVGDKNEAIALLRRVGYYRLTGFAYPLRACHQDIAADPERFRDGASLAQVAALMEFDARLRVLLLDGLLALEVLLRERVAYVLGQKGSMAHLDRNALNCSSDWHAEWVEALRHEIHRSNAESVAHPASKYPDLPIWAATGAMSFGSLSKLMAKLRQPEQQKVTRYTSPAVDFDRLRRWVHRLSILRNSCAHAERIWNLNIAAWTPPAPTDGEREADPLLTDIPVEDPRRLGMSLSILAYLLRTNDLGDPWTSQVSALIASHPRIDGVDFAAQMGLHLPLQGLRLWSPPATRLAPEGPRPYL